MKNKSFYSRCKAILKMLTIISDKHKANTKLAKNRQNQLWA